MEKNVQKGGERGGIIANPKIFIANLCMSYEFSGKKRNVISKKGRGGGQGRLEVFQKNIHICGDGHPLRVGFENFGEINFLIMLNSARNKTKFEKTCQIYHCCHKMAPQKNQQVNQEISGDPNPL